MFSGPVTIITSMPALERSLRARAIRPSYSAFGNADSEPCWTLSLVISVVSNELGGGGIERDAQAGGTLGMDRPRGVGDARNRIVDEPVSPIELGEARRCCAGNVKRRGGGGAAFMHLADHEGNAGVGQLPCSRHGLSDAAEFHKLEVRIDPAAIS